MTLNDLIERYPIRVRQPGLTGLVHVLVWWTHDEQYHCIVGRSEAAVDRTYGLILSQPESNPRRYSWSQAEPREYYIGEVCGPSRVMQVEHAVRAYESHKDAVIHWVTRLIDEAQKVELPLPSTVSECTAYRPDPGYFGEDAPDEYQTESHYKCLNCFEEYCFKFSRDELYQRFEEHYKAANDWDYQPPSKNDGAVSRAKPLNESKDLFVVSGGHGGIHINTYEPGCNSYGVAGSLFCFQGQKLDVPAPIRQRREAIDKQKNLIKTVQKQHQHKEGKKKHNERRQWLEAFLIYLE
jgi:hypothetical protein